MNLRIKNVSSSEIYLTTTLSLLTGDKQVDYTRSVDISGLARDVALDYDIHEAGDSELSISVSDSGGEILHALRTFFHVPQLYAADYGYLISEAEGCSIWWAEGTHKISRERPLPTERRDEVRISAARNEYEPFQLVLRAGQDMENV